MATTTLESITGVAVALVTPAGDHAIGTFTVSGGKVSGTDQRGIAYEGTVAPGQPAGAEVTLTATVPAGTRISDALATEAEEQHTLRFALDAAQLAGESPKPLTLPGLGVAAVRFTPAS